MNISQNSLMSIYIYYELTQRIEFINFEEEKKEHLVDESSSSKCILINTITEKMKIFSTNNYCQLVPLAHTLSDFDYTH